jgi:WD40 repeat protein
MKRLSLIPFAFAFCVGAVIAQTSRSGDFYAETEIRVAAEKYLERNLWTATVYARGAERKYQLSREVPYDVPFPTIYLSDDGRSVLVISLDGLIEFYDQSGNIVGKISPFPLATPDYERVITCSIAGDRAGFVVSESRGTNARLILTDLEGHEAQNIQLAGKHAGQVYVSNSGSHLLASSYSSDDKIRLSTVLFERLGKSIHEFDMLFRHADISEDDELVVMTDRNALLIAGLDARASAVRWTTGSTERVITDVKVVGGLVAAVVEEISIEAGKPVYTSPSLVVVDRKGQVVATRTLTGTSSRPAVLRAEGSTATLSTGNLSVTLDVTTIR